MSQHTLLIELGTEELPPKALSNLSHAFSSELLQGLLEAELIDDASRQAATAFATPRRLALQVSEVASKQADQQIERRGPAIKAAL